MHAAAHGSCRTAGLALAVLLCGTSAASAAGGSCGPSNPFGKAWVCVQDYALCISAPCTEISATGPHGEHQAQCVCEVIHGASIGEAACGARAPVVTTDQMWLISTYSFQQTLPDYKLMTCPAEAGGKPLRYVDCYNQKCIVDLKKDPGHAVCTCPVLESKGGTFITRGGKCNTATCSTVLWSGAPTQADIDVNWQLACDLGMPHPPEAFACPQ